MVSQILSRPSRFSNVKLVGTTKPTIKAIRERSHWNITNIVPTDPVLLGLCKQIELVQQLKKLIKKILQTTSLKI